MQKFPFKVFVGNSGFEPYVTEWLVLLFHIQEIWVQFLTLMINIVKRFFPLSLLSVDLCQNGKSYSLQRRKQQFIQKHDFVLWRDTQVTNEYSLPRNCWGLCKFLLLLVSLRKFCSCWCINISHGSFLPCSLNSQSFHFHYTAE